MITIYTDGSPKKIAYVMIRDGQKHKYLEDINFSTNFEAEYKSIIGALHRVSTLESLLAQTIRIINDNATVVLQILGRNKVKEPRLQKLHSTVIMLKHALETRKLNIKFDFVYREQNIAGKLLE